MSRSILNLFENRNTMEIHISNPFGSWVTFYDVVTVKLCKPSLGNYSMTGKTIPNITEVKESLMNVNTAGMKTLSLMKQLSDLHDPSVTCH